MKDEAGLRAAVDLGALHRGADEDDPATGRERGAVAVAHEQPSVDLLAAVRDLGGLVCRPGWPGPGDDLDVVDGRRRSFGADRDRARIDAGRDRPPPDLPVGGHVDLPGVLDGGGVRVGERPAGRS